METPEILLSDAVVLKEVTWIFFKYLLLRITHERMSSALAQIQCFLNMTKFAFLPI